MILTDKEIQKLDTSRFWFEHTPHEFARVIEAAVLVKLANLASEQEPAAWWDEEGVRLRYSDAFDIPRGTPLYFHPAPTQEPLSAEQREQQAIGAAINRACMSLPDLSDGIEIRLKHNSESIYYMKNDCWTYSEVGELLSEQINAAIDAAIDAAIEAAHNITEKP